MMHYDTLKVFAAARSKNWGDVQGFISCCHHFHIQKDMLDFAKALAKHEIESWTEETPLLLPINSFLPAREVALTVQGFNVPFFFFSETDSDGCRWVKLIEIQDGGVLRTARGYEVGGHNQWAHPSVVQAPSRAMVEFSFIWSLINTPRKIDRTLEAGSRQHRKAVLKSTGRPAVAWTNVSWEVGKVAKAKKAYLMGETRRPTKLHWCRAYVSPAKEGEPRAIYGYLPGYGYRWIRQVPDSWRGHPAFGTCFQRHAPRFTGGSRADFGDMSRVDQSTKWAALSGAHRAALVDAGYAPTSALH